MTPSDFKAGRQSLGLTLEQLGYMLGYVGNGVRVQVHHMETEKRTIRECQARLMQAYLDGYRPEDWPK